MKQRQWRGYSFRRSRPETVRAAMAYASAGGGTAEKRQADILASSDDFDVSGLFGSDAKAEAELDLRGLELIPALEKLGHGLAHLGVRTVRVLIDPASPTSGETLFQPVGRYLLEARRDGDVLAMSPLQAKDRKGQALAGFLVHLPHRGATQH